MTFFDGVLVAFFVAFFVFGVDFWVEVGFDVIIQFY